MASQQEKVLRIGVIQGGKIVEERVLPARQPVTVGTSSRNTVAVPQANLPESQAVFSFHGDRYVLQFDRDAEGRIEGPQGAADFGALVSQGLARSQGRSCSVPVNDDQRGNIVLGDVTILWQFVAAPAEVPRPSLPKEAKGAHFKSMDRLFVSVLVASLLLHSGAYIALARTELPKEITLEEIPDRYARLIVPERLPQPARKVEEARTEAAPEQKLEKKEAERKQETPEQNAERKAARAAAVAKAVQSKGILKVLGALGPGSAGGAVADVFGSGAAASDVASALSGAGGVAMANDPRAAAGRKGGGDAGAASIGELATTGGGQVGLGAKSEVKVSPRPAAAEEKDTVSGSVAMGDAEMDSSDIDRGKLGSFVRARQGLIRSCYENALKRNPRLHGRIAVRFTILATGGLADVSVVESSLGSPEVVRCIVETIRSWRTQFRPPEPVTVEYPFVLAPGN